MSLSIPPWIADIDYWGREVGGEWWALVVWWMQVSHEDGSRPGPIRWAAWVPGLHVKQPMAAVEYLELRRMQLGAEPAEWPAPTDRPGAHSRGYYLGVLDGGEPQLPAEAGRPWGRQQASAYG